MTRLRVLAVLPAVACLSLAEIYRRGFVAPLVFGVNQWRRAFDPRPETEADLYA